MGKIISSGSIAGEFSGAQLGDVRRSRRLVTIAEALGQDPSRSFPQASGSDAALEGTYRFLGNEAVSPEGILQPHYRATAGRCTAYDEVLVLHDTTTLSFQGESSREGLGFITNGGQGFFAHVSLAVAPDESRIPLGCVGLKTWARTTRKGRKHPRQRVDDPERESLRWQEQALAAEENLAGQSVIHVMDREGDAYETLCGLSAKSSRFVVRAAHTDRLLDEPQKTKLVDALDGLSQVCERTVAFGQRRVNPFKRGRKAHPARDGRLAQLSFAATTVRIKRSRDLPDRLPEVLELNVVHVQERSAPEGESPVEWLLLTTEPIDEPEEILRVVDSYRARWTVEEYFKALKSGCAVEQRQLESLSALENALAVMLPVAWRMLLLRSVARTKQDAPASWVLTKTQLEVLQVLASRGLPDRPTVQDALMAVAALGGHIKNNGQPGWQILARGYHDLLRMELGWLARAQISDQS